MTSRCFYVDFHWNAFLHALERNDKELMRLNMQCMAYYDQIRRRHR